MTPPDGATHLSEVRRMLEEANARAREEQEQQTAAAPPAGPPPNDNDDGGDGRRPKRKPTDFIDRDCPVRPLGLSQDTYYYLDAMGQLRDLKDEKHGRLKIAALFGTDAESYLRSRWPAAKKVKDAEGNEEYIVTGWKPEEAAISLMSACAAIGVWSPRERVRGPGMWRGDDGELVLHMGDQLLIVPGDGGTPVERAPGMVGRYVYPADKPGLRPHKDPQQGGDNGPGKLLLDLYSTWAFERGRDDAHLRIGTSIAGMMGAALDRRPVHWETGGRGTGKSTLQDTEKLLFGQHGMLQTADATPAGIRQTLRYSSLPVRVDEAESKEDNRRLAGLLELARSAHTGSITVRGGQDHEASSFNVYSCVGFSSILMPPMKPQDLSRIIVFRLNPLPQGAKPPRISRSAMEELGSRLLRRIVDGWCRFPGILECYREALGAVGHDARGQDVFGTVLACAHLALNDGEPLADMDLAYWQRVLAPGRLDETQGDGDQEHCLTHLLTQTLDDPHNKTRLTIADWIRTAAGKGVRGQDVNHQLDANDILQLAGLKVVSERGHQFLAVANKHAGLSRLYQGTHWASAADTDGVWKQSLARLNGARKPPPGGDGKPAKEKIGGAWLRCQWLPLGLCLETGGSPSREELPLDGPQAGSGDAEGSAGHAGGAPSSGAASHTQPRLAIEDEPPPDPAPGWDRDYSDGPDPHDPLYPPED